MDAGSAAVSMAAVNSLLGCESEVSLSREEICLRGVVAVCVCLTVSCPLFLAVTVSISSAESLCLSQLASLYSPLSVSHFESACRSAPCCIHLRVSLSWALPVAFYLSLYRSLLPPFLSVSLGLWRPCAVGPGGRG